MVLEFQFSHPEFVHTCDHISVPDLCWTNWMQSSLHHLFFFYFLSKLIVKTWAMTQCRWTTRLTQSKVLYTVVGWSQKGFNLGNVVKLGGQFFLNFLKEFFALGQLEYYRSVNLESNLWSANFSQKTNSFVRFLGEVTARQFCFEIY